MGGCLGDGGEQHGGVEAGEAGSVFHHFNGQAADVGAEHEVQVRGFGATGQVDGEIGAEEVLDIAVVAPPAVAAEPGGGEGEADVELAVGH